MRQLELNKKNAELDIAACQKTSAELQGQVVTAQHEIDQLKKDIELWSFKSNSFEENLKTCQTDKARNFSLLIAEHQLRVDSQQMIPHGEIGGVGGKLLKALDSPYFQFAIKIGVPIANTFGTYTRASRCVN